MGGDPEYLYRGTTEGWPGNDCLREEGITCTTTDPLVATLFAVECRNHGPAIILAAPRAAFERLIGPENFFKDMECAINLRIPPVEFARRAVLRLDVDRALERLRTIGFDWLSVRIGGREALREAIKESHLAAQRLNPEQIRLFNQNMREIDQ